MSEKCLSQGDRFFGTAVFKPPMTAASNNFFLGSFRIYPKLVVQPIVEKVLLTGQLETTNELYAVAKIAGIKMCESFNHEGQ